MEAGGLSLTRPSALHHAFWAAGDKAAFASQAHPSSLKAMRLLMLLDNAYLLFSTTFNTLCVGAALVWYLSLCLCLFCRRRALPAHLALHHLSSSTC